MYAWKSKRLKTEKIAILKFLSWSGIVIWRRERTPFWVGKFVGRIVGKSVVIYLCWLGQNFAATSLRLESFFFVSAMARDLLRESQLRRGAYRSTNFCIKISSYLSRVTDRPFRQKDRPNSNFCDQKRTPVNEFVQYIWSLFWQRRGMRYFNLSILFDAC